jgi:hypothetical protein
MYQTDFNAQLINVQMKYSTQVRYGRFDARISSISASEAKQAISCPRIMATTAVPIKSNATPEKSIKSKTLHPQGLPLTT